MTTPAARPFRRAAALLAALALLGAPLVAAAQTLAEVTLVAAIAAEFNPMIRMPRNSFRAVGAGTAPYIAKVPDASAWTDWEVYTATGVVAGLQGAFVGNIANNFAVAGYFEEERTERQVGGETHTRYVFGDGSGRALLYVVRSSEGLVWMIARAG